MDNQNNPYLKDDGRTRHSLRVTGWITFPLGLLLLLGGWISFAVIGLMGGFPIISMILFVVGGILEMVGLVCLFLGYMKKISHYMASQGTPVATESANYLLHGTRDELKKTVDSCKEEKANEGIVCPKCGVKNEAGAAFCDHCGAPLTKICPSCGEVNDADSTFCRKCGKGL